MNWLTLYRKLPAKARAKLLSKLPLSELRQWPDRLKILIGLGVKRGEPLEDLDPINSMLQDVEAALRIRGGGK